MTPEKPSELIYEVETRRLPILSVLRNPHGFTEDDVRSCRLALCDLYEKQQTKMMVAGQACLDYEGNIRILEKRLDNLTNLIDEVEAQLNKKDMVCEWQQIALIDFCLKLIADWRSDD